MNYILENWDKIFMVLGPIASFLLGKELKKLQVKKASAEVEESQLNNISSNFKVYQDLINDLEVRFKNRISDLELDLDKMKTLNSELRKAISNQEKYIKKLQAKLEEYEKLEK